MACPSTCPFWDSADLKRREGWQQQEPGQGRQCHHPTLATGRLRGGDRPDWDRHHGAESRARPSGCETEWEQARRGRPLSTGDMKPSRGSQPAQGLLYLSPFILGRRRVIREVKPIQGLASRAFPGKETIGE